MKTAVIRSSWLKGYGYRLDCQPYLSGGLEAKVLLEKLPLRKDKLRTLTTGFNGGIYNGPKFSRTWVESPEYGVPFVGSSAMQYVELSGLPLLSKKLAYGRQLKHLELQPGMSLISCSGTIGKMVYARHDMAGIWSSQHILKVVADPKKIPSGYLYAYLCSKFGVPLVVSGTYGSIIQSLGPEQIADLPVPRLAVAREHEIHALVEQASKLRTEALFEIDDATESLQAFLNLPSLSQLNVRGFGISAVSSSDLNFRLDATYHSPAAKKADQALNQCCVPVRKLSDPDVTRRLFKPPMFKRLWVDDPQEGAQFVSGIDAYKFRADDARYVSYVTPNFSEFIVREGWLIFQAAGQIYGLFARPLFVHGWLDGLFVADDMYRIVPNSPTDGAYLFAFFRTDVGQVLIKRQSAGNSIPRVWDPQMSQLQVPWPPELDRRHFGAQIIAANEKLFQALQAEQHAVQILEKSIEKGD
jgi:type I restriction enzyme S subunit